MKSDKPTFSHRRFAHKLTQWFITAQRDLPWRESQNSRDGYRVLVSEVMLQQTTVAAVVPFYHRFLERFPDIQALARADLESEVLPLWAGLGYYSRARNLHAAARNIVEKHNGIFPRHFDEILALPGVGRYTAGAVCSIAFNQKVPIVDANVARILSRIFCIENDIKSSSTQTRLWQEATNLVEVGAQPSQFNPAMMELGALVCVPKTPRCEVCPISQFCGAYKTNRQSELPQTTPKKVDKDLHDVCIFIGGTAGVLLRQRSAENSTKKWWRGMWELPRTTIKECESVQTATQRLLSKMKIEGEVKLKINTMKHGVTVHAITLDCFEIATTQTLFEDAQFFAWEEIKDLAIPSTMRKLLNWLQTDFVQITQLEL